jgi:hypothetical protein
VLALTDAQFERIQALERQRFGAALAPVLAGIWPAVAERLGPRWPAFVASAVERAAGHGLTACGEQADFVALCGLWGASFDARPGFEWAAEILRSPRLDGRLKIHQLLARARAELPATGPLNRPAFDAALQRSAVIVAALERATGVFADTPEPAPLVTCDLATVRLAVGSADPLTLQDAPTEPLSLPVLAPTTLKLAVDSLGGCGRHPELRHDGPEGRLHWHGPDARRLPLSLPAPREAEPGLTGIAHSPGPALHRFTLSSCGVREAGAPFGSLTVSVQAFARTAWHLGLRHGDWPAARWPEPEAAPPAPLQLRLEADGRDVDTTPWQQQWLDLQAQWRKGLDKLFDAWARDLAQPTMEAEARLLSGQARLAWAWRETPEGIAMQASGRIDLVAAALQLSLAGQLRWGDSVAELRLQASGHTTWQQDVDPATPLESVACSWRHPLTLTLLPCLTGDPALLHARPGPAGALTGKAGLRPRPDGRGQQWFCRIELEPVVLPLSRLDPVLGEQRQPRPLLPALVLLDWSAG